MEKIYYKTGKLQANQGFRRNIKMVGVTVYECFKV